MRKIFILIAFTIAFAACKKHQISSQAPIITGKWHIVSVTLIPLDSTGNVMNQGTIYPEPDRYFFQFNNNNSWNETLSADPGSNIGESGSYVMHGDTSFTLININAPANAVECHITTLTAFSFVFAFQRPTLFNGTTPGYLKYIFELRK